MTMPLRVTDAGEWARWLETHTEAREVWLIIRKKGSRHPGICIEEAIEEAIAHGWIDSQMRALDVDEPLRGYRCVDSMIVSADYPLGFADDLP